MPYQTPTSMKDELDAWNEGKGIPIETWTELEGNYSLAVGYAALLWPGFKEVGSYIVVESVPKKSIKEFEKNNSPKAVEYLVNRLHLDCMHLHDDGNLSSDKLLFLGTIISEMWEAKLRLQYPDRPCTVEFYVPNDPDKVWDYYVTFWQTAWDVAEDP